MVQVAGAEQSLGARRRKAAQCRDDLQRSLSMKRATPSRVRSSNRRSFWVPRPSVWEKKFRRKSTGRKERSCWVGPQQGRS